MRVSPKLQVVIILAHIALAFVVLLAVTLLDYAGKPITAFTAGIFGSIIGIAGGSAAAAASLGAALNGKTAVDSGLIANQQQIIREQGSYLASGAPLSEAALAAAKVATDAPLPGVKA